jgi:hypothetical protein
MRGSCPRRTNKPNVAPWPPRKRQRTPRSQLVGVTVDLGESEQWPLSSPALSRCCSLSRKPAVSTDRRGAAALHGKHQPSPGG